MMYVDSKVFIAVMCTQIKYQQNLTKAKLHNTSTTILQTQ